MIELTQEMRDRLARALDDRCPVVAASADAEGQPKISFYGSTHVHSSDQLAIWVRDPSSGVLDRIAANPHMAFLYRNTADRVSWQFFGRARVVDDPDERERVWEGVHAFEQAMDPERKGVAVVVDVDRVTGRNLDMVRERADSSPA